MKNYAEQIYVLVHRCHEQCLKLMPANNRPAKKFSETGINTRQGIILRMLPDQNGLPQKELTERLEITSSSCGELIAKLELGGYLEKRTSPDDKRTFNVTLTDSGRALAKRGDYARLDANHCEALPQKAGVGKAPLTPAYPPSPPPCRPPA